MANIRLERRNARRERAARGLDLPPPFRLVALREAGDAVAHAARHAGELGAGTLVFVGRFDLAEFAIVLEPEETLAAARRVFYAGMVALVDRYVFSLMARARVRGLSAEWVENLFGFALIPDLVVYLDIDIDHLVPRVLSTTGFDYWESGQDYLPGPDVYGNFVEHQTRLLAEFRRLATEHAFTTVDARATVVEVFKAICEIIEPIIQDMAAVDAVLTETLEVAAMRPELPGR